jgi:hypothetical protein
MMLLTLFVAIIGVLLTSYARKYYGKKNSEKENLVESATQTQSPKVESDPDTKK